MKYKFITAALCISIMSLTACKATNTINKTNEIVTESTENISTETEQNADSELIVTGETAQTETNSQLTEQSLLNESTENTEIPIQQEISVKELKQTMYAKSAVNVRKGDSTDYEKLGSLSFNQEIHVTGQSESTGWYRIEFNGETGFVSQNYLSSEKTVVTTPLPTTNNNSGGGNNNNTQEKEPSNWETSEPTPSDGPGPGEYARPSMGDGGDGGDLVGDTVVNP